jgi:putative ABC transport system ATP-binding protein
VPTKEDLMIYAQALGKTYQVGDLKIEVLKDITLSIPKAKFIVICGPSGSGKTTLLNIIGGIDKPTSGKIFVAGQDLTVQDEDFLSDFRCNNVGFVFQSYNLVSTLTVAENVAFPMEWTRKPEQEIEKRVTELLETLGLQHRANHFPAQLSGGEQQRVAFARALANDPQLILADEPTGNLDTKNAQKITQVLQLLKERGKTVIVSTHEQQIRELADQVLCLEDGKLASKNE